MDLNYRFGVLFLLLHDAWQFLIEGDFLLHRYRLQMLVLKIMLWPHILS